MSGGEMGSVRSVSMTTRDQTDANTLHVCRRLRAELEPTRPALHSHTLSSWMSLAL